MTWSLQVFDAFPALEGMMMKSYTALHRQQHECCLRVIDYTEYKAEAVVSFYHLHLPDTPIFPILIPTGCHQFDGSCCDGQTSRRVCVAGPQMCSDLPFTA